MNIEALGAAIVSPPRVQEATQQVVRKRQESQAQPQSTPQESKIQPEELLNQIKKITEDGLYSVRFERDPKTNQMVVKVVNSSTDEVIRQIPPEDIVNLSKNLNELKGNLVNTAS